MHSQAYIMSLRGGACVAREHLWSHRIQLCMNHIVFAGGSTLACFAALLLVCLHLWHVVQEAGTTCAAVV